MVVAIGEHFDSPPLILFDFYTQRNIQPLAEEPHPGGPFVACDCTREVETLGEIQGAGNARVGDVFLPEKQV